jgi:asparagine synthase (glutamine-hydrolysing)
MNVFLAIVTSGEARFAGARESQGAVTLAADARIDEGGPILDAYCRAGERCVVDLIGDFSFALWDGERRRLVCARDFLGVRQLYYAQTAAGFLVSNSMAAILAHPSVPRSIDESAAARFLIGDTNEFPVDTFYPAVKRLPPAHTLVFEDGRAAIRRYWSLPLDGAIRDRDPRDTVARFRSLLERAVADRLGGESVTAMMSGGMDSGAVALTAARILPRPLHAYTTSFARMLPDDEAVWAARIAEAGRMVHHVVPRDDAALFEDEAAFRRPEPFEDPLASVFLGVARDAARHAPVMLAGQGGDVLFYTSHGYFRGLIRRGRLLRFAGDVTSFLLRNGRMPPLNLRAVVRGWFGAKPWRPSFPPWIREGAVRRFALRERFEAEPPATDLHPHRPEAHRALMMPAWQRLFETWEPSETGIPIRIVYPYFDRRLVELLFALPPMPWFADKHLLRESMRGRMPEEVRRRPKTPLARDPLRIVMRRSLPQLRAVLGAAAELDEFIDAAALFHYLENEEGDGYSDLLAAYPFCLARWWSSRRPAAGIGDAVVRSLERDDGKEALQPAEVDRLR